MQFHSGWISHMIGFLFLRINHIYFRPIVRFCVSFYVIFPLQDWIFMNFALLYYLYTRIWRSRENKNLEEYPSIPKLYLIIGYKIPSLPCNSAIFGLMRHFLFFILLTKVILDKKLITQQNVIRHQMRHIEITLSVCMRH